MKITSSRDEMIFKNEKDGKVSYLIGMSKKNENGEYESGFFPARFRKGVSLENQTKIRIKDAWLDFFKIEKRTLPFMFINDFDIVNNDKVEEKSFDNWGSAKDIEPDELPFY